MTSGDGMHDRGSTPGGMILSGNQLNTNAQLMNPPADFRPRSTSPAIDRGESLSYVAIDHAGRSRPQWSGYDVGAFEYGG